MGVAAECTGAGQSQSKHDKQNQVRECLPLHSPLFLPLRTLPFRRHLRLNEKTILSGRFWKGAEKDVWRAREWEREGENRESYVRMALEKIYTF